MNKKVLQKNSGFMLLELVIYLGLFSILMGGALASVYAILESNVKNQSKALVQEEGNFLLGKIDWALTGAEDVSISDLGKTLTVEKFDDTEIVINFTPSGDMVIARDESEPNGLNNLNVTISGASFTPSDPEGIEATFTLEARTSNGLPFEQEFSTIKFMRK